MFYPIVFLFFRVEGIVALADAVVMEGLVELPFGAS